MNFPTDSLDVMHQLATVRRQAKITQLQVAKEMNTTASAISRLELGGGKNRHSPSVNTLKKYASVSGKEIRMDIVDIQPEAA